MTKTATVANHYAIGNIVERIRSGLKKTGINPDTVSVDQLSLADEFHIGGRVATEHLFEQMDFEQGNRVLDIGSGIGGGARFAADRYGVTVDGIDLTETYVEAGIELNKWVGLDDRVTLRTGSATSLDYPDGSFDSAFSIHVCMNIKDKGSVFREASRVIKHGGLFGIYDPMKYKEGSLDYPVPWAADETTSHLEKSETYIEALSESGFEVIAVNNRHQFAVDFFEAVNSKMKTAVGPPPLGVHLLMGDDARAKVQNVTAILQRGLVAPFEIIARKK